MRKLKMLLRENIEPIGKIDYGVFIVFFILSMLFIITIVQNI